jgi:MoxR-like ATPase
MIDKNDNAHALTQEIEAFRDRFNKIERELAKVIVGNNMIVRSTLGSIFAGGHVLLEGVPGLGKTLLIKSIARVLGLSFKRIQFTPDLMPSDITGTQVLGKDETGERSFIFKPGPLFANIILADEINRATPKTQSALLEAMEERQVTVLDKTYKLPSPFFVLATQNPVDLEGTYPLPEAQLDRFLFKVLVTSPTPEELKEILIRTTGATIPEVRSVFSSEESAEVVNNMKNLVRKVFIPEPLQEVLIRMIGALTPGTKFATNKVKQYLRFGPGPRGAQAVIMAAKFLAILDGRINVSFDDMRVVLPPALRHRLILNFHAEAEGITSDAIIAEVANAK